MDFLNNMFSAVGSAVSALATAWAVVYVVGMLTKTFLIFTDKATPEQLKDWFNPLKKNNHL